MLATYNFAVVSDCLHNRARVYHLADARLYAAIGQLHSRYRRPVAARQVSDRLLRLDAVVSLPDVRHVATEDEKISMFSTVAPSMPRERLPHVGAGSGPRVRLFPDDQPIAVSQTGRVVFTYVVAKPDVEPFRAFVQRHADLLSRIAEWTVRLVLPKPFAAAAELLEAAARRELTDSLRADLVNDLRSYFRKRRAAANRRALTFADPEFWEADVAFNSPRFRQLYRRWLVDGDSVFVSLSSPALAQALERGTGRIESHVLDVSYGHLSPVVSTFRACRNGVEGSDIAVAQPRPPSWLRPRRRSDHLRRWRRALSAMDTDSAPAACGLDLSTEMGRRLVPPPTAVPIATAEEPWRERPRELRRAVAQRPFSGSFTPRFPVTTFDVRCCVCLLVVRRRQRQDASERAAGDMC